MTEDQFFAIVDATMLSERRKIELKAAARVYAKARIADSQCSTLRGLLVQLWNKEQEARDNEKRGIDGYGAAMNQNAIMVVISLIDEMEP